MRLEQTALLLDERDISCGAVVLLARFAGLDASVSDRLAARIATARLATGEGLTVSLEERQQAFDDWRRRRDLIRADDYRQALEDWGVDREAVMDHVDRCIWFDAMAERVEVARELHEPTLLEVLTLLPDELLFEGKWGPLVAAVTFRLVAANAPDEEVRSPLGAEILQEAGLGARATLVAAAQRLRVPLDSAEWLLERETAFRRECATLLARDRLDLELRRRRSELEVLELDVVQSGDEDVANEVFCCAHLDGEPLDRVAARAKLGCVRQTVLFKDLGQFALGARAAGARAREVIGPVRAGEQFAVGQLVERRAPSHDDSMVRGLLESRLLRRELGREVARRVRIATEVG